MAVIQGIKKPVQPDIQVLVTLALGETLRAEVCEAEADDAAGIVPVLISHIHRIGKKADTAIRDIVEGIPAWKGMVLEAGCFRVISGQIRAEGTVVEMNPAVIIDHRITKLGSPAHRVNHGHAKLLHQTAHRVYSQAMPSFSITRMLPGVIGRGDASRSRFLTKMSRAPLKSPSTRLVASLSKATKRPLPLSAG